MPSRDAGSSTDLPRASVPIDLRRRPDALLQVSRLAAELFWRDGVAATRGEDIAAAAGISPRTLWRYFRSKESCVEPVLDALGDQFSRVLASWPPALSLHDHLHATARPGPVEYSPDQVHAMHVIHLGRTEPALRSAWLMVCDEAERRCLPLVARRLGLAAESVDAQRDTAAISGAMRALNDALTADYVERGHVPLSEEVLTALVRAVGDASGGRVGPAVVDLASDTRPAREDHPDARIDH